MTDTRTAGDSCGHQFIAKKVRFPPKKLTPVRFLPGGGGAVGVVRIDSPVQDIDPSAVVSPAPVR